MTPEALILLGMDFALQQIEKSQVDAKMAELRAQGKSDAEIGTIMRDLLDQEIASAKADSAARRS